MDESTLMRVFDMLNERLYAIEQSTNRCLRHMQRESHKEQLLPADLFGFPFDVVLDDHKDATYSDKSPLMVWFDMKRVSNGKRTDDLSDFIYMKMKDHSLKLDEWVDEETSERIYDDFDNLKDGDDSLRCCTYGIETPNNCVYDYVFEKYMKSTIPQILGVYLVSDYYFFVVHDIECCSSLVDVMKSMLSNIDFDVKKIETMYVMYDSLDRIYLKLALLSDEQRVPLLKRLKGRYATYERILQNNLEKNLEGRRKFGSQLMDEYIGDNEIKDVMTLLKKQFGITAFFA
jgi:hypothetical protein